jgi:ABC-type amino acid transport substrate-binding protein
MRTKTLRCGYFVWPPYLIKDANTGKFSGAGHDIIEAVASGMGLKVDWNLEVAPNDIVAAFNGNKIDAYCLTIFETLPRTAVMDFVGPLGYAAIYAYVRGDETRINSLNDIDDPEYTISVLEGEGESALAHARFAKAKFFEAPSSGTSSDKYTNVVAKKADVVITEAQSVLTFLEKNPGALKRATDDTLGVFPLVFAVKKGESQLNESLNQAYHVLQSTGAVDAIWQKYNIADDVVLRPYQPYKSPAVKVVAAEPVAATIEVPAPEQAASPAETSAIPEIPGAVVMPVHD